MSNDLEDVAADIADYPRVAHHVVKVKKGMLGVQGAEPPTNAHMFRIRRLDAHMYTDNYC